MQALSLVWITLIKIYALLPVITGSLIFLIHATFLLDVERGELLKASDLIDFLSNENQMDRRQQLKYRKRERYIRLLEYYTRGWLS